MVKELLENFNPENYIDWLVLIAACIAILVSAASFPAIRKVAEAKNLMDASDSRSSHSGKVPNLGGIGIYLSIVVAITIIGALLDTKSLLLILGSITLLFFFSLSLSVRAGRCQKARLLLVQVLLVRSVHRPLSRWHRYQRLLNKH